MWLFLYRLWRLVGGSFLGRNLGPKAGSITGWLFYKLGAEALNLRLICSALALSSGPRLSTTGTQPSDDRRARSLSSISVVKELKESEQKNKQNDNKTVKTWFFSSKRNSVLLLWILNLKKNLCVFVWISTTKDKTTAALEKTTIQGKKQQKF